jgi:acetylornithine deacetylase/succinyl-diaminopimelate desuccinylase-like protein
LFQILPIKPIIEKETLSGGNMNIHCRTFYIILLVSSLVMSCACTSTPQAKQVNISTTTVVADAAKNTPATIDQGFIQSLSKLQGRETGTSTEKKAAQIIARKFNDLNLKPLQNNLNFYFQPFPIPAERSTFYHGGRLKFKLSGPWSKTSQNIVGMIPGDQKKYIIISAHYDGQGINNGVIYPSVNDNLSGISTLLTVAQKLQNHENKSLSYVFVAFGAEEVGLYGSQYFADHLPFPKKDILGVINIDTVSSEKYYLSLHTTKEHPFNTSVVDGLLNHDYRLNVDKTAFRTSDHQAFNDINIPALTILAQDWQENNHTKRDTLDKFHPNSIYNLSISLVDILLTLDDQSQVKK